MLLAILAGVVIGAFGVGLRMRLALTLVLIAAYVPIAGAGPSIQRAGVMGAAAIVATLLGRPSDRAYAGLLAAAATLLIDPRFGADVGWQLSFAAVAGIMLWASPLRRLIGERLERRLPARLAAPLAEGHRADPGGHGRDRAADGPSLRGALARLAPGEPRWSCRRSPRSCGSGMAIGAARRRSRSSRPRRSAPSRAR